MTSSNLSVSSHARDSILSHTREGAARDPPEEVCGVLVGDEDSDSISSVRPVSNIAPDPRVAYELDPAETVAVIDDVESVGADVVGFYHSHPESAPIPSATDREQASWTGYVYLICNPDGRMNAYEWTGDEFREVGVDVK
ncbi:MULTISPECIES: desampylase [Haloferax]|uniref:Peptidase n=1 Tax=Haloferax marinum TaxID=2666143 RepID=A0A6A8G9A2_9EURY|nr:MULTISPECIES: desampylase [Haloferax]KAB1198526.1 M67 family metallopeptidase [Haloferax sp. CBA1150]MRW97634.1 peptidase [Haloferax marinum]